MERKLHCCWLLDAWKPTREKYLRLWQKAGWDIVLWHGGQIEISPVDGVELRNAAAIIDGSPIARAYEYEKSFSNHAGCADLFRYELLYTLGGAYADVDIRPGRNARPSLFDTITNPMFGRAWLPTRWHFEIRFIASPKDHHPLLERLRDTAVERTEAFINRGGYEIHGVDNLLTRTGPVMAESVVKAFVGKGYQRSHLLKQATYDNTAENGAEHYTLKHPEIRRLAAERRA